MKVLYLTYDGLTDGLGRSQVIPYLEGIAAAGHKITVVSFEKPEKTEEGKKLIRTLLQKSHIDWLPLTYTVNPPVISTIYDILSLRKTCRLLHGEIGFQVVHCRSYITSLIGLHLKRIFGIKFIFDMRAFYADERVDGGLWPQSSLIFRAVYKYFKKKEKEFLSEADYTISLTTKGKEVIHSWSEIGNQPIPIEVIPCCADLNHFNPRNVNIQSKSTLQNKLGLAGNELVLTYLGSIGTWYMLDEMLDFFKALHSKKPESRFFFITLDNPRMILEAASKKGIPEDLFIITPAVREAVPTYLSLADIAFFFIKPVFSKTGSSPTKHGEMLGMGIPIICNGNVGDMSKIVKGSGTGIVIEAFEESAYLEAINEIDNLLKTPPETCQKLAEDFYSLKTGVKRYQRVYQALNNK
jgi:glycosyltransferase involved in cell wall biosynthesis